MREKRAILPFFLQFWHYFSELRIYISNLFIFWLSNLQLHVIMKCLKGHGGGKKSGWVEKMWFSQNFCVPLRNFAFPRKTFAFSRKDICVPRKTFAFSRTTSWVGQTLPVYFTACSGSCSFACSQCRFFFPPIKKMRLNEDSDTKRPNML